MGKGIPGLEQAYHVLFLAALIFLAIMVVLCLVRAIIGPKIADRIVAINMMGTMIMVIIAILALMLESGSTLMLVGLMMKNTKSPMRVAMQ